MGIWIIYLSILRKHHGGLDIKVKPKLRKISQVIIIILIVFNLQVISNNSQAVSAEVVVTIDESEIEFIYDLNSSRHMYLSGNVTCNI